ncbi:acyl-CoA/acyl-ACP dehydrogenase [Frankia sp. CNm7]|uniref:Acyl-CoA/acyl-ACP dehydrogenase n=1 Tax=Frankia nepalensis TaxID=1836974 RepID=A0A937RB93_9ACTN|nr:acyl-CoA dehydrogenase family protein [Frankia nepalensis]MBL7498393.1 acyl-CoA/acyl-ACP dehydrogenase [Frankia nepalensis]MBL7516021.1 acyl-CoA/acyl-ACP dehydrogenase [Frankia nepalensis]MBL7521516.1 acyl-CoA/acyl-ACP dehydrogenase [Frankia nepalensis]MBL7628881.1 acyl-CoA/acyl-ACP dehydrogenase [Frankia nepalensis]
MTETLTSTTDTDSPVRRRPTELPVEMLERFRSRAGELDRANAYFDEDLRELREIGYLAAAVPVEHGGWGLSLAELARSQRRLARYAPATALAMTMHSYWIGVAREVERLGGDESLRWIYQSAVAGEVIAAGHAEAGNDIPVLFSTCQAERVEGGYRLTGRKQFGSNGPAWAWLGAHAIDVNAAGGPQIVHAFVARDSEGVTVVENWDTLGMRPTQSHDTILDDVFVPDDRIGCVVPAGDGNHPFLVGISMWPLSLIGAVYLGIAERALELAAAGARRKTSMVIERGALAYNPMIQHQVAEMYLELDAANATLERFVDDWTAGVDHGEDWVPRTYAMKWRCVEAAKHVVDTALDVAGGAGMFRGNELERLYRDVRCGGFHPGNDALTHEMVGKAVLGILADQPRW